MSDSVVPLITMQRQSQRFRCEELYLTIAQIVRLGFSKTPSSFSVKPPSGPINAATSFEPNGCPANDGQSPDIPPAIIRQFGLSFFIASIQSCKFIGGSIWGKNNRLHCLAAEIARFIHRSSAFGFPGCLTVRSKITGLIRSTPSSVHFSISQSNRSPLGTLTAIIIRRDFGISLRRTSSISRVTIFFLIADITAVAKPPDRRKAQPYPRHSAAIPPDDGPPSPQAQLSARLSNRNKIDVIP